MKRKSTPQQALWMVPADVAELMGVGPERVYRWIEAGELEAVNLNHRSARPRYRISQQALDSFLTGKRVHSLEHGYQERPRRPKRLGQVKEFV